MDWNQTVWGKADVWLISSQNKLCVAFYIFLFPRKKYIISPQNKTTVMLVVIIISIEEGIIKYYHLTIEL